MAPAIPRVLHQTWSTSDLPPPLKSLREGWIQRHPHWKHCFYDDASCLAFVQTEFPEWETLYTSLARPIQRADLFRYLVVYRCGGVYADLDMRCFRCMDPWLHLGDAVFSIEARLTRRRMTELRYPMPYQIANCVFGAAPGHPFLAWVLNQLKRQEKQDALTEDEVEDTTGPRMLTRAFYTATPQQRGDLAVLPQAALMAPKEYRLLTLFSRNACACHEAVGSWRSEKPKKRWSRVWVERNRWPWPWPRRKRARL